MGCGDTKEKIENEMAKIKMERIEVQMERKKQLQLLKGIDGIPIKLPKIPDYIDKDYNSEQNTKRTKNETEYVVKKKDNNKLKLKKSKSIVAKDNIKSRKSIFTSNRKKSQ